MTTTASLSPRPEAKAIRTTQASAKIQTPPPEEKESTGFFKSFDNWLKSLFKLKIPEIAGFAADMEKLNTEDQIKALKKELFTASESRKRVIQTQINQVLQAHNKIMQQLKQGTFEDEIYKTCEREVFGDELI